MAQLPLVSFTVILLHTVAFDFGHSLGLRVILGDPVMFPGTTNCSAGRLDLVEAHGLRPVAERAHGVCTPSEDYKDRVDPNGCFAFKHSVYTDNGMFEFTCGSHEEVIQLEVLVAFSASVTEGEPVKLECHIIPHEYMEFIQWERNDERTMVLHFNLSTREIKYGTGFEGRARPAPDYYAHGDWSLIWDQALLEDQGDYFCSAYNKGRRKEWGQPGAGRLKVGPDQTSLWIIISTCFGVGLCVACILVWYLKFRRSGS